MTYRRKKTARAPIVTVLRVKDEERYIQHTLESLRPLGGPVILLDDGSTDSTPEIVKQCDWVEYHWQDLDMDEGRDRTWLYRAALETGCPWILVIDGDEVLEPETPEYLLRAVEHCPDEVNVFALCFAEMASTPDAPKRMWHGAVPYGLSEQTRMWRVRDADREHEFGSQFAGGLHCGVIPPMAGEIVKQCLNAWVCAYGYETAEQQEKKLARYEIDAQAHAARVRQMKNFNNFVPVRWVSGADCREMGKRGTVRY